MENLSKAVKNRQSRRSDLPVQILGILLMALALLVTVSLVSNSSKDPPNSSRPPELAENLGGWIGAQLSYYILFVVGYGAYPLTLLVFLWGWNRLRQRSPKLLFYRSITLLTMTVLYCGATGVPSRGRTNTAWRFGGWIGVSISSNLLVPYLGRVGSFILLVTMFLVLLMLATNINISRIPDLAGRVMERFWRLFLGLIGVFEQGWKRWKKRLDRFQPKSKVSLSNSLSDLSQDEAQTLMPGFVSPTEPKSGKASEKDLNDKREQEERRSRPDLEQTLPDIVESSIGGAFASSHNQENFSNFNTQGNIVYSLPDLNLLNDVPGETGAPARNYLLNGANTLELSLRNFNIDAKVVQVNPGPVITCYEVEPPPGVKVSRIVTLSDDLALVMKARSIRIQAPIPGKAVVGVEVPNPAPSVVYLREILESRFFQKSNSILMLALGKMASGEPFCADLAKMPHLLIAGATGSGKSVCINALISSILFRSLPEDVRFIMVDPKMLELSIYNDIPHLLAPVVTSPKKASEALKWVVAEMEGRYRTMAEYNARNILDFNSKLDRMRKEAESEEDRQELPDRLPYIVVVIDELADLMMTAPADIEDSLARLAQMARAVGIHLILATQRPSVNVITGTIKANFPSRIAFRVASKVDSRTILDSNGAEKLLGNGDMLFLPPGKSEPIRIHGANISTEETEQLVEWVSSQGVDLKNVDLGNDERELTLAHEERDERFEEAVKLVITHQQGSASLLQRRMKVGYARAARLVDELEQAGIVSPSDGSSKAREVLVDEGYWEQME